MLASPDLPQRDEVALRVCISAGEALPADIGKRWTEHFGVEILDGIGSTEMLHIFISNRPGEVRYGTTGKPVPGYQIRLVDEHGQEVGPGELGELQINGPTSAIHYWNNRARSLATFVGPWTRAGDKYSVDEDGYYTYGGRSDDMLKVSGMYVSPFEVEAALVTHPDVLEAAVIGVPDEQQLIKPKAFVVTKPGVQRRRCARRKRSSSTSKTGWRPTSIRAGSSSSPSCPRPQPERSSASSCAHGTEELPRRGFASASSERDRPGCCSLS